MTPERSVPRTLRESLAALEHEQWIEWSQTIAREGLTPYRVQRWERYWVPYAELDEGVKEHDRKWADRVLALVEQEAAADGLDANEHLYRLLTDSENRPTTGFVICECGDVQSIDYDDMADKIEHDIEQAHQSLAAQEQPK